jgi:hypothetical protein
MTEIRLPANNVQTNTWDEAYYWHIHQTGSKTLRIVKCGTDDDDKERVYPEFTGFNTLREAFVKFFSIFPTKYVKVGSVSYGFDEAMNDNIGAKFFVVGTPNPADLEYPQNEWIKNWLTPEEWSKGFYATKADYRKIKTFQFPAPQKFTIIGSGDESHWYEHALARDSEQLIEVVKILCKFGMGRVYEGHLPSAINDTSLDEFGTPESFRACVLEELKKRTAIATGSTPYILTVGDGKANEAKIRVLMAYLDWYNKYVAE